VVRRQKRDPLSVGRPARIRPIPRWTQQRQRRKSSLNILATLFRLSGRRLKRKRFPETRDPEPRYGGVPLNGSGCVNDTFAVGRNLRIADVGKAQDVGRT